MVKKGYYGNEGLGLPWDHMKVSQTNLFTTTHVWEKTLEKMDCYILICSSGIFGSHPRVNPAMYETA